MRGAKIIISALLIFIQSLAFAQPDVIGGVQIYINRGDDYFKLFDYDKAIEQYEKALKYDKENKEVILKVANSHRLNFDDKKAEEYYRQVEDILSTEDKLYYAEILKKNGKYDDAKKWYKEYLKEARDDYMARNQLYSITHKDKFYRDTMKYVVSNARFNTANDEYAPFFLNEKLYFISDRSERTAVKQGKHSEIFYIGRKDSTDPKPLIKHYPYKFEMGAFALTDFGNKLVFTRTIQTKQGDPDNNKLKLYEMTWNEPKGKWEGLKEIPVAGRGQVAAQPALTGDGKILVFVSDSTNRTDGRGGADLYISYQTTDGWTTPKNMGKGVNTAGREHYPYFANDSVLYFSSTGHPGLGGMDIFKMALSGPDSGKVVNMGAPINSSFDDYGLTFTKDKKEGWFGSNRDGGKGRDDLYHIELIKVKKIVLEGFTKDIEDKPINMGQVVIYDNITKERLGGSDENGYFRLELDDSKDYELIAKAMQKPQFFEIHFEGFVKDRKDSTHQISLDILDPLTMEKVSKELKNGYITFNLQEGRDYKLDVDIADDASGITLVDVHFEGFVMDKAFPHFSLGEVHILNSINNRLLFKSGPSGFFNFTVPENEHLLIKAFRRQADDYFELNFEGFIKDKKDTNRTIEFEVIDPETGKPVARNENGKYLNFVLENGKDYNFKAIASDSTEVDLSDIHFEGFVKDVGNPVIVGQVEMKEAHTDEKVFKSNEKGFFNFKMDPNQEYNLRVNKRRDPKHNFNVWLEGFVKNEEDTSQNAQISLFDPETGKLIFKSSDDGFFAVSIKEDFVYKALAELLVDTARYKVIEKFKFEGFASDAKSPVMIGKVKIWDSNADTVLSESDDFGFFQLDLDPKQKYSFVAKKDPPDTTGGNMTIAFKGFVKDQDDSLTFANLTVIDPETGKEVVQTQVEGYFKFELEENKTYEIVAKPVEEHEKKIGDVRLVLIEEKSAVEQVFIQDKRSGKYFEVRFEDGAPYYTDGVKVHRLGQAEMKDSLSTNTIVKLLKEHEIKVKDSLILHSIFYATNSVHLGQREKDNLNRLAKLMRENKNMRVVVSSYADAKGSSDYNKELTIRRNNSVITYISHHGVKVDRIKSVAYGEFQEQKHCKNCKEESNSQDRRTDILILSY